MKKIILAAAVLSAFAVNASAQQTTTSDHSFSGNVSVVSDYRFRGVSQTQKKPAIQGGFDYSHSSGFYIGNWNSSISSVMFPGSAGVEMDLYGGYKTEIGGVAVDVGLLKYIYPDFAVGNTLEFYVGASWNWLSAKYSRSISDDTFGFADTKGSDYLDLNANFEIAEKTVLGLHVGRQNFKGDGGTGLDIDYTDYRIGLTREFDFGTVGLAYVDTDAKRSAYTLSNGKYVGNSTVVLSLSKAF